DPRRRGRTCWPLERYRQDRVRHPHVPQARQRQSLLRRLRGAKEKGPRASRSRAFCLLPGKRELSLLFPALGKRTELLLLLGGLLLRRSLFLGSALRSLLCLFLRCHF